jgi:hypothetical protein
VAQLLGEFPHLAAKAVELFLEFRAIPEQLDQLLFVIGLRFLRAEGRGNGCHGVTGNCGQSMTIAGPATPCIEAIDKNRREIRRA